MKSKLTPLKKYTNWAKLIYFSFVLREREDKKPNILHLTHQCTAVRHAEAQIIPISWTEPKKTILLHDFKTYWTWNSSPKQFLLLNHWVSSMYFRSYIRSSLEGKETQRGVGIWLFFVIPALLINAAFPRNKAPTQNECNECSKNSLMHKPKPGHIDGFGINNALLEQLVF